ncbi:protochlorophyllide-dependent translocon component 52, chloroplastic [Aristolochia californica]|uniref:protochlorophyllide-dependent translocon component 52, chloroplastic n=1 Tax=Aristolochia californica TaxID=171875 RepID=UPI0035DCD9A5
MDILLPSSSCLLRFNFLLPKQYIPSIGPLSFRHPRRLCSNSRKISHVQVISASSAVSSAPMEAKEEAEEPEEKFDWFANWYPLAPVCDLDKKVPHAKRVMGLDVVIWWDRTEETWKVFDDRCPHRLAPLSEGRIDSAGRLQCVYHGWCFNGSGDCKFIPQASLDDPPVHTSKRACVAVYPSCEQNKIVWFWPNSDPQFKDILSKKKPPSIDEIDDPSYTSIFGIRDIPYGYEVLIENLMDPAHVHYAHYKIMPMPKTARTGLRAKRDREGGLPLDMMVQKLDVTGYIAKLERGCSKFIAPCLFFAYPKSEEKTAESASLKASANNPQKQKRALLIFLSIPVSPGQSRLIWVFPRNFSLWANRLIPRWVFHVGQNLILDSDLYLLHLEERKIFDVGQANWHKACFVPTKSDALVSGFRRWLRKYGSIPWDPKFGEGLPPSPPKEQLMDRYQTHVVHCSSCRAAEKGLKILEVSLQVVSIGLIGFVAALKQNTISSVTRSCLVSFAILCFMASKWLAHFVYKNFHFHDYDHALV